jgi:hypothetical protein
MKTLVLLMLAACSRHPDPACQVGSHRFTSTPTLHVTFDGPTCKISSVAECTYCLGPVANLGAGNIECIDNTYDTEPCLQVTGTTVY